MNSNLNKFNLDAEELVIREGFSRIEVNTERMSARVRECINEGIPGNTQTQWKTRRLLPFAAAIAALFAISTTVFAVSGGFDLLFPRAVAESPMVAVLVPVMDYAEDQGIRVSLVAARRYENSAILYFAFEDISGENLLDGPVSITRSLAEGILDFMLQYSDPTTQGVGASFGVSFIRQHTDAETGIQYRQMRIRFGVPIPDTLGINFSSVQVGIDGMFWQYTTIEGDWQLVADFGERPESDDTITINLNPGLGRYNIYSVKISPLGVSVSSSAIIPELCDDYVWIPEFTYQSEECEEPLHFPAAYRPRNSVPLGVYAAHVHGSRPTYIETTDGLIRMERGGTLHLPLVIGRNHMLFETNWIALEPLNLDEITAVIIDGQRIAVQ